MEKFVQSTVKYLAKQLNQNISVFNEDDNMMMVIDTIILTKKKTKKTPFLISFELGAL